ncbi:hypothetical protein K7X08_018492 [Anisodus acutangulus]|uniref:Uncharacterized protein n=1 Tax=Anisodus acutangulus TaxID=402998 RepID=A0A9Q1R7A6_9SOLA|nr:hypothetical protein K7X08_018492 [Anisodus acutangulus]
MHFPIVCHVYELALIDPEVPAGLLTYPEVSSSETRSLNGVVGVGEGVNLPEKDVREAANLDEKASNLVDVDVDGNILDYVSSDSDLGEIPLEDGSDVDEELRAFRQERSKKVKKKAAATQEIPVGEAIEDLRILGETRLTNMQEYWVEMRNILTILTVGVRIVMKNLM